MNSLWADISTSDTVDTVFRFTRIQENRDWFLPICIALLLAAYFYRRYHIDAAELKRWQRIVLLVLRSAALVALLLYYVHPQWEHFVGSSRVAILLDTSSSMAIKESGDAPLAGQSDTDTTPTRLKKVLDWIEQSKLVEALSEKHDVAVYSFDKTTKEIGAKTEEIKPAPPQPDTPESATPQPVNTVPDFTKTLLPTGTETQLGEALQEVLQREKGQPLAGILLFSDGGQNAGRSVESPIETASRLKIPIYTVGVGLTKQPLNFRVGNLSVPERTFPNDPFKVRVPIEMLGGGEKITVPEIPVELYLQSTAMENAAESKIGEKKLKFDKERTLEADFEVKIAEKGKQRLIVRIKPPEDDKEPEDNAQKAEIEIVDRKDKVLFFASAPTRDYQFISAQVYRDKSMTCDVFLPWAKPGIKQSADNVLEHFPQTKAEMSAYDTVVAFDPNWRDLSNEQIDILEHWVARQGGGLIVVAGTVHLADTVTGWVTDPGMDKVRALYPVEFLAKQTAFEHRYHGDAKASPLKFSQAGQDADFLRPMDNPAEARSFWNDFAGFYGFFAVKAVKPTATLLVSSTATEAAGQSGTLLAEQFYGAGRVLYLGSGELWRLRGIRNDGAKTSDDGEHFEKIITKTLRHISQGRLQRESDRGSLTTDQKRYSLGSTAQLRITANDASLNPLNEQTVPVDVQSPSGIHLLAEAAIDPNMPGSYSVHIPMSEEGQWLFRFKIPGTETELTRTVQAAMSDLERENPVRNESLLQEIAAKTGGHYFKDLEVKKEDGKENPEAKTDTAESPLSVAALLKIRSQKAVPDAGMEQEMLRVLLISICAFLMLEWTLRRLMKLV
jgi:hypothetical protein